VLWVKGSGGDLRTSELANFASLYQAKLLGLRDVYASKEPRGVKTEAEDAMADCYAHCAFNLNPRAASIDTPLHSFVTRQHVDHMHPNAVISIAASRRSRELTSEVYGEDVGWTPWLRPGFELGLELERRCQKEPLLKGIVLGQHGLINWADDDLKCYRLTLSLIDRAAAYIEHRDKGEQTFGGQKYESVGEETRNEVLFELLPWLRGRVASGKRSIATVDSSPTVLRFVNSHDAARLAELGTACPDHFLRTKIKPLYISWDAATQGPVKLQKLAEAGLEQYRRDYAAYYARCQHPDSPAMRDPNPTVILIPGVGMVAWGKNKAESRTTAEFYNCAIEVMRGAEAIDEYVALPEQEAFDIEYWRLEEAKLKRMPKEKDLSRSVVLICGAGAGMGSMLADWLADQGAHLACVDADGDCAAAAASAITDRLGLGPGVGGSGISTCGPAMASQADVRDRESVRRMLMRVVEAYGGVDHFVLCGDVGCVIEEAEVLWARQGFAASVVVIGEGDLPTAAGPLVRVNAIRTTVEFLLSERSAPIRNQVLAVDGRG
jgi:rhamnulose-1-phosphate aldolase/alcohol dehydrogenase